MLLRDVLLPEFDHEMAVTRRVLARVPYEAVEWKPHPKSMTLGQLASHLADIPGWASALVDRDGYDMGDEQPELPRTLSSPTELLETFDRNVATARALLVTVSDGELLAPWTLKEKGQDVFTSPKLTALRAFLFNHAVHHRGQLCVYLRERDVPVPSIYGPSADER